MNELKKLDETVDENAEALWANEIRRRDKELRNGSSVARPVEDVLREARERLRCMK